MQIVCKYIVFSLRVCQEKNWICSNLYTNISRHVTVQFKTHEEGVSGKKSPKKDIGIQKR
jgi:hypothetical protein